MGTGGVMTMIITVFVSFSLAAAWMGRYGDQPATACRRLMVGSLLPIVLGYVVAHYATLLIVEGQPVAINFSDPLGRGWNAFGSTEMGVNSAIFTPRHAPCNARSRTGHPLSSTSGDIARPHSARSASRRGVRFTSSTRRF
jgi:hypothetical protein